jgi:hypothetical protein
MVSVRTTVASPDAPSGYATAVSEMSFGAMRAPCASCPVGSDTDSRGRAGGDDDGAGDDGAGDDGGAEDGAGDDGADDGGAGATADWASARPGDAPSHATPTRLARHGAIRRLRFVRGPMLRA